MKATLNGEKIVSLKLSGSGVEIGDIPHGVDLNRLRWNGSKLIDLAKLDYLYVEEVGNNFFEVYLLDGPNRQRVRMKYRDRKYLINDGGTYRVKRSDEIQVERNLEIEKSALRLLQGDLGGNDKLMFDVLVIICGLIIYQTNQIQVLTDLFTKMRPHIVDLFTKEEFERIFMQAAKNIKASMTTYKDRTKEIN